MIKKFPFSLTFLFLLLIVPALNFLVLQKSFNLGLYGDDWLQLYNLWLEFDIRKTLSFFDIRSYLGAYLPQYIFLGIIRNFAGYEPQAYFFVSYILKIFSSIGIYFFSREVSKSSFVSALTVVLFIFSAAGLETTDWVFNMNTFAGLGFFGFAGYFYLRIRSQSNFYSKEYFLFVLFLALSLFVVPVRMHGAVPFLIFSDLFLTFLIEKKKFSKLLFFRILTAILLLFLFVKLGSYGTPEYSRGRTLDAFKLVEPAIARGDYDFLFYFFGTIGNVFVPDKFSTLEIVSFTESNSLLKRIPFNTILVFSFILFLVNLVILTFRKPSLVLNAILNLGLTLIAIFINIVNAALSLRSIFAILVGLNFFGLGAIIFFLRNYYPSNFIKTITLALFWVVCFSGVYWLYSPHLILETTSRYLTFAAFGVSLFLGALISQGFLRTKNNFWRILFFGLFTFYILTHFIAGQNYFSNLEKNRSQELTQKSWDKLLKEVPDINREKPSVFYFTTDNPASLFGVFTFGFWPKAGMVYKITEPEKTPLAVENYPELLEYVKTGEPLKRIHGRKQEIVELPNVYAFDFRNGQLINKTQQIRERLSIELKRDVPLDSEGGSVLHQ